MSPTVTHCTWTCSCIWKRDGFEDDDNVDEVYNGLIGNCIVEDGNKLQG